MTTPVVHIANATIRYGKRVAVDDVSLVVERGSVYALLGRNGAGKSSLVRCLLGQLRQDRGTVELFGADAWRERTKLMLRTGVVSEEADAPPDSRVRELASFSARLYPQWQQESFDKRLARFGIASSARFGELSKGQKKQVALALALASAPELLILAIVALPAMIVAGGLPVMIPPGQEWKAVLASAGAILVLFLAGHAVSTMVRSRSLLLGLDLLGALTAAAMPHEHRVAAGRLIERNEMLEIRG